MRRSESIARTALGERGTTLLAARTGNVLVDARHARFQLNSLNPLFLNEAVGSAISEFTINPSRLFEYSPTEGLPSLCDRLAARLEVVPTEVFVTDGASQGILLLLSSLIDAGDRVLIPSPGLPAYSRLVQLLGGVPAPYIWHEDVHQTIATIEEAIDTGPRAIILNSPHNPTGDSIAEPDLKRLLERARQRGVFVILDDAYGWMEGDADKLSHFARIVEEHERGVAAVCSLGKYFCMPGLRLGCVVTRNKKVLEAGVELKRHMSQCSCPAQEALAAELLAAPQLGAAKAALTMLLQERRRRFIDILTDLGARVTNGSSGFYVYANDSEMAVSAGIDGIQGTVFGGAPAARRYCIATSQLEWDSILSVYS